LKIKFFLLTFVLASILVSFFYGCSTSTTTSETVEILPADRLVKRLEANRRKIRSFEGSGTLTIKTPDFNNSASFDVVMIKPDSIYLTIMGPFGIELAQALVTKRNFTFYEALSNTVYMGETNDDVLRNILRIDISFSDLLDAIIGAVNLTDRLYKDPDAYQVQDDKYVVTYNDSLQNTVSTYAIDIRNLGITKYTLKSTKGKELLLGEYTNFSLTENVATPKNIAISNKNENQYFQIDYKSFSANKKDIQIDFKFPPDATIIKW
jgi:outer membrane biogenesis lipoprotein LolB